MLQADTTIIHRAIKTSKDIRTISMEIRANNINQAILEAYQIKDKQTEEETTHNSLADRD
jgi:hypothetical protein